MTEKDSRNDMPFLRIPPKYPGESCSDLQVLRCEQVLGKTRTLSHRLAFYAMVVITRGSGFSL